MEALPPLNRLFVAAYPPAREREAMAELGERLAWRAGGRAVPADRLHLTLDFLGQVPPELGEALAAAVVGALEGPPIAVRQTGLKARPGGARTRLVAVELEDSEGQLAARTTLVRRAVDAVLGRPADERPLWPHVTLMRLRRPCRVELGGLEVEEHLFDISRAGLYHSHQSPDGPPRYRELAGVELVPVQ